MGSKMDEMELKARGSVGSRSSEADPQRERDAAARNMEGLRGVLAEFMPGALTDDMTPDELRRLLSARLSNSGNQVRHVCF
jgi:hypothetical protein